MIGGEKSAGRVDSPHPADFATVEPALWPLRGTEGLSSSLQDEKQNRCGICGVCGVCWSPGM